MIPLLQGEGPAKPAHPGGRGALFCGLAVVGLFFGGLGTWAVFAPLDSAAVAPGEVIAESQRKTIEHLEGGIVGVIHVKDGDQVKAGDRLVTLDPTRIEARREQLHNQLLASSARLARLVAERDGVAAVGFPVLPGPHADLHAIVETENRIFLARRSLLEGQVAVAERQIAQSRQEIVALQAERVSRARQFDLIDQEQRDVAYLVERGLAVRPRLLALQRQRAALDGEQQEIEAKIARAGQAIAQTELSIVDLRNRRFDEVVSDIGKTEAEVRDLKQQLVAVEDSLLHTILRAPQDGIVIATRVHAVGDVIGPHEPVLDLVPAGEALVIEARIQPVDIDSVGPGLPARIRMHNYKQSTAPVAEGTVSHVSADLFTDQRTGEKYYRATIGLKPESLAALPTSLMPGMQADVLIGTGERTALDYALAPLVRNLRLAMREP
jgi:HlyD family type I secretion membrane fusion protein